jgi:predicted DNA-binding transcriptional regulator YafY
MAQSKTARWLDLIAYLLQHRFPVTREEIFEHVAGYRGEAGEGDAGAEAAALESVRRKFERDKDELRALGIEIETVQLPDRAGDEAGVGYRLRARDFYLPYLELAEKAADRPAPYQGLAHVPVSRVDLSLLDRATRRLAARPDFPLSAAAASARRKLEFDLPLPLRSIERVLSRSLDGEAARSLEVLQQAVAEHVAVDCLYFAIGRDAEERRVIEPYGLFFTWGRWYTAARARDRDAMRVFRVDRVREAELLTGKDARFTVPATFSVRHYLRRSPWELTDNPPTAVRVRFAFPESRWVLAQGVGKPVEPLLGDGGAVLEFEVRDTYPFLRWLLTFRDHATVQSPGALAEELEALRRRVATLYAADAR